jgi:succinate dehydrogenase / fumarate reductase, iron-sulfur subunit
MIHISVYRYNPDKDKTPYMQDYEIDPALVQGVMVLNLLEAIKANLDESLAFRRSCGEGVCGSDGMNINGKNQLACITPFAELGKKIVLRPFPGMKIIRDLIVDMSDFYAQYEKVDPYLQPDNLPVKEQLQSPEDREKLDGLYECILCGCCSSSCPSYWWNTVREEEGGKSGDKRNDEFLGPAALLTSARFVNDSRDGKKDQRLDKLQDPFSLYRCRGIMNCTDVCPKGLNPRKAITELQLALLKKSV